MLVDRGAANKVLFDCDVRRDELADTLGCGRHFGANAIARQEKQGLSHGLSPQAVEAARLHNCGKALARERGSQGVS